MLSAFVLLGTAAGLALSLALLFLPTLVARSRHHPNTPAIFLVNLFFGWSLIGWVVALVWAYTRPTIPALYAPVYPQYPAVRNAAVTILPPRMPYRGAR